MTPSSSQHDPRPTKPTAVDAPAPPLFVDLDGTLIDSDILWEATSLAIRRQPALVACLPLWAMQGRSVFKRHIANRAMPEVDKLPYRHDVIAFLREERTRGRTIVLATANDRLWAEAISARLGLFDDVIATDAGQNIKGRAKLAAIRDWCRQRGGHEFGYIGDSRADLPIWREAAESYLVTPSRRLLARARQSHEPTAVFGNRAGRAAAVWKVLRPHQWVKNLLIFLPILMAHRFSDWPGMVAAGCAFVCFSLFASAVYVINDFLDVEADRHHPTKRHRPFASGALPLSAAPLLSAVLLAGGALLAWVALPAKFLLVLAVYLVSSTLYSVWLKRIVMVDVMILAGLYTLRILAGGVATGTPISEWLTALSMFLFTSLAFAKRYAELARLHADGEVSAKNRGYLVSDLSLIESMGPTAGYLAVLVLALYIHNGDMQQLYPNIQALWLICPLMLYWISRLWLLAKRKELHEDPVVFAIKDRVSWVIAVLTLLLAVVAVGPWGG